MMKDLVQLMGKAFKDLESRPNRRVAIFHHNDTDGLTSGAILRRAFERKGYGVDRFALEKPYPPVLEKVLAREGEIVIFADFAGRIAPMISRLNAGRNLVLILDHHVAEPVDDPCVHNLDPDLFGLKGDMDISASVTCFAFAQVMDPGNVDLAHIAALGAVGDEFFLDGKLVNENRRAALEAERQGRLKIAENEGGESYTFVLPGGEVPGVEWSEYMETLGGVGYYSGGPDIGVQVCLEGFSEKSDRAYAEFKRLKDAVFDEEIRRLKAGEMHRTDHIQWFHVHERLSPMGVKMIGAFCDLIKKMDFIDPGRYLAGFQRIPDVIPGFGAVALNQVKISMRVSGVMEEWIRSGKAMALNRLLPDATSRVGGFSDACHSLTAATTIEVGKEESLIGEMERILESAWHSEP
ncbi:MAG: hypothetical protein ABFD98_16300 [Syntrophobacteraceae bacterium]